MYAIVFWAAVGCVTCCVLVTEEGCFKTRRGHRQNRTAVVYPHHGMPLRHKRSESAAATTRVNLEDVVLREGARHQRLRVVWFHLHQISGMGKFMEADHRCMLVPGGCGWRVEGGVVTADGFRFLFGEEKEMFGNQIEAMAAPTVVHAMPLRLFTLSGYS